MPGEGGKAHDHPDHLGSGSTNCLPALHGLPAYSSRHSHSPSLPPQNLYLRCQRKAGWQAEVCMDLFSKQLDLRLALPL